MANKVFLVPTPTAAIRASGLTHIDFADPQHIASCLMALRNGIVAPFGLKASIDFSDRGLGKIDVFPIISSTSAEIVIGGDDKHLDFRI